MMVREPVAGGGGCIAWREQGGRGRGDERARPEQEWLAAAGRGGRTRNEAGRVISHEANALLARTRSQGAQRSWEQRNKTPE